MSRSYKTEDRAAARQERQRRDARHSKIEWRDNFCESPQPRELDKKTVVGRRPALERIWTPSRSR